MYVRVLSACVYMHYMYAGFMEARSDVRSPEIGVKDGGTGTQSQDLWNSNQCS